MANANPSFHQYEPLRVPKEWTGEEKKFIQQLSDIFDDIYRRYGRLRFEDMGTALKQRITSTEGIMLEVGNERVFRAESELVLLAGLGAKTPPVEMAVGLLWLDTTTNLIKRCTAVTPLTWASVQVDEVHTAGIDISPGALSLWASLSYNMAAGTGTSAVGMSNDRPDTAFMWAGNADPALAPFRVNMDGSIYAKNLQQVYSQSYWDMADEAIPASFEVFIPSGYTMDSVAFTFKTGKARTFAKGASSGGGQTSGSGGGSQTTSSIVAETEKTSYGGSGDTGGINNPPIETVGGGVAITNLSTAFNTEAAGTGNTGSGSSHGHVITNHRHSYSMGQADTGYTQPGAVNEATHTHTGPSHRHQVGQHTHDIAAHQHYIGTHTHAVGSHSHKVTIDAHNHTVDIPGHTHDIDAHTHDLDYGINEKAALATSCVLKVNGTTIGTYGPNPASTLEIKAYLTAGWNSITVQPNDDARISVYTMVKITAQ